MSTEILKSLFPASIHFNGHLYTPNELKQRIAKLIRYITQHCSRNSPFIFLYAHNHIKTIDALFAILEADYSCVLVDPKIGKLELAEYRNESIPTAEIKPDISTTEWNFSSELIINKLNEPIQILFPSIDEPCILVYTYGVSGYSKAAVLGIRNIYADAEAHATTNNSNENSVVCSLLPFHHLFGLVTGIFSPMISHCHILIENPSNLSSLRVIATRLSSVKVSHFYSVPAIFYLMKKIPRLFSAWNNKKYLTSGAYKLPVSLFDYYSKNFDVQIQEGYGLTEASPVCTWHHPGDEIRISSVGKPLTCCQIDLIKDEQSITDDKYEIIVKGTNIMKGYLNDKNLTNEKIKDGWLRTGDYGKIDNEQYVYLTGLKKRMFNIGGKKAYPAEIERLIFNYKKVERLNINSVYDELEGDKVSLDIKLEKNSPEEIQLFNTWLRENTSIPSLIKHISFS